MTVDTRCSGVQDAKEHSRFISGEGAGSYQAVVDVNGQSQDFPGWSSPNSNAFFCHRSANASIHVASLPDIDLVLVGLGSNNSIFTFGNVAADCAGRFVADRYIGWWEFWVPIINCLTGATSPQDPCTADDLATAAQLAAAQAETTAALRNLVQVLDEIDADGQYRIVLQDYTNPLPLDFSNRFYKVDRRTDKFRDLVRERYIGGCPAHRASLGPAHQFSEGLGTLVQGAHATRPPTP